MRLAVWLCLLAAFPADAAPALKAKAMPNPVLGAWVRVAIGEDGDAWADPTALRWEFMADGRRKTARGSNPPTESRFTVDTTASPMTVEF